MSKRSRNASRRARQREARHTWDASQRQTLCLLHRFYDFNNAAEDITKIFNVVHKAAFNKESHPHGLREVAIRNQLWNLSHRVDNYIDHREILNHNFDRIKIKYQKALATLEKAMLKAKIAVKAKSNDPKGTSSRKFMTREPQEKHRVLYTPSNAGYGTDEEVLVSNRKLRNLKSMNDDEASDTILDTMPDNLITAASLWVDICRRKRARLQTRLQTSKATGNGMRNPILVFRAWTQSSGLKARKTMANPPVGDQLRHVVEQHLDVVLKPSPFLSTSRSLRHALRRAREIEISTHRQDCFVSVILYKELVRALDHKYGPNSVYMATDLCQRLGILGQGWYSGEDSSYPDRILLTDESQH